MFASELNKYKNEILNTQTTFIKLITENRSACHLEHSKIGGMPYWPENLDYPTLEDKPAKLVAQINFSQMAEQNIFLEGYPKKGILQFFSTYGDGGLGMDFDEPTDFNPLIKVIYHEDTSHIPTDDKMLIEIAFDDTQMPFEHELKLNFSFSKECLSLIDEYNAKKHYSFLSTIRDEEEEVFYETIDNTGSKIGGYAYFTQYDPRPNLSCFKDEDWVLLLQIDSDDYVMWGDCGVANWFIRREDLLACRFDRVFFHWDCH